MKRNLKITISALAVLLVMALTVTVLSFSLAGSDKEGGKFEDKQMMIADTSDLYTNIDNIIENSYATGTDADPVYKIVEIGSAQNKQSTLSSYVADKAFEQYVINGHKSMTDKVINPGKVEYTYYWVGDVTDSNTEALAKISNADFVYVSNDSSAEFAPDNDLCEELYNFLHTYAVGYYKPLVIDKPSATSSDDGSSSDDGGTTSGKTIGTLAGDLFETSGKRYYTFGWDRGTQSTEQFFTMQNGSKYLGINGKTKQSAGKWKTIAEEDSEGKVKTYNVSKFLTITSGTGTDMTQAVFGDATKVDLTTTTLKNGDGTEIQLPAGTDLYDVRGTLDTESKKYQGTTITNNVYNKRYSIPDYVEHTVIDVSAIEANNIVLDDYDFIIIEKACGTYAPTNSLYKALAANMYGGVSMIYDKSMATASSGSNGGSNGGSGSTVKNESNYLELYYMVANDNHMAKYENIMITTKSEFSIITSSRAVAPAKVIADLINSSAFRGIGGPGASSNMFTVLEIQPCYPIDEELALEIGAANPRNNNRYPEKFFGKGNYYIVPDQVVNGKTKEQLEEGTEYYAWELSKAKIADVTGLPVSQINLVQMSSEELASTKTDILGEYDLIYVGGNTSAIKDVGQYQSLVGMLNWTQPISSQVTDPNNLKKLPIYGTYSHTGDFVRTVIPSYGAHMVGTNSVAKYVNIDTDGNGTTDKTISDTFAVLNGNDITYNNYVALEKYINAGMPVVISEAASVAFEDARTNGYLQNSMDPDSNMFKFLKACYDRDNSKDKKIDNVLFNFDNTKVVTADNDGGRLGDTLTGYVMVFAGSHNQRTSNFVEINGTSTDGDNSELVTLLAASSKRPRLTVTSSPAIYNMYDNRTKLPNASPLNFTYRVTTTSSYTVSLYIDDDGNSKFADDEVVATGDNTSLTFTPASSFYGPLYWKLEVKDKAGMTTSITGLSYIKKPENTPAQTVRVLQIMPARSKCEYNSEGERANSLTSLYFCTVCQQSYGRLEYNPDTKSGDRYHYGTMYQGMYRGWNDGYAMNNSSIYLGKHEHKFGIVKYDSTLDLAEANVDAGIIAYGSTGMDNWDENLADEVSDLYEFDLDIMFREEFEAVSEELVEAYDFSGVSEATMTAKVNTYATTITDQEVKEQFEALATLEEKYKFVVKSEYSKEASDYLAKYSVAKEERMEYQETLNEEILKLKANASALQSSYFTSYSVEKLQNELQRLIDEEAYWDIFSLHNRAVQYNSGIVGSDFLKAYNDYALAKDKEIEFNQQYKEAYRYAHPDNWMYECYDAVVIGAAENFASDDFESDIALADIVDYVDSQGTLLFFHDTFTAFADGGPVKLTAALRSKVGMDRFNMTTSDANPSYYINYTSPDSDRYFTTNLSYKNDGTQYASWLTDMKAIFGSTPSLYLSNVSMTDVTAFSDQGGNNYSMPYKYVELEWNEFVHWNQAGYATEKSFDKFGTNRASQNNKGIVTMFPFTLSDELNIAGTHSQAYALDLESDDTTVWYSLAAGPNKKTGSSIFAASPRDGMDNYFIYSHGNTYYCGAGHSKVTGIGKDNNDERRLYINIICNSVRKSVRQPDILVYDYNTTENEKFKPVDGMYITKVEDMESYPEFSFLVRVDETAEVANVKIYYDLDYLTHESDKYVEPVEGEVNNHPLIANWNATQVRQNVLINVFRYDYQVKDDDGNDIAYIYEKLLDSSGSTISVTYTAEDGSTVTTQETMLKLQPRYFDPYNGQYTYIVIEVTDTKGNITHKRIKIELKDKMFDYT